MADLRAKGIAIKAHSLLKMEITENSLDRLSKAIMEQRNCSLDEANDYLCALTLKIECGDAVFHSAATQASIVTAVNSGCRAFRGGVFVDLPPHVPLLLPWPNARTLNDIVQQLGGNLDPMHISPSFTIAASRAGLNERIQGIQMAAKGWIGAIGPLKDRKIELPGSADFALGGILAGGIAVGTAFLQVCGLSQFEVDEPTGVSLWRPDLDWRDEEACGPQQKRLPSKLMLLGLGHLGQAFAWTLGLLHQNPSEPMELHLFDYDRIVQANLAAGVLCNVEEIDMLKTRVVQNWLEKRGIKTRLYERKFDENFALQEGDPRIAMCGFDKLEPRQLLDKVGWDLVVDVGIGGRLGNFDRIRLNTFPDQHHKTLSMFKLPNSNTDPDLIALYKRFVDPKKCGMIAENLAGKSISSAFVGMIAGTIGVAEILRGLHGGDRIRKSRFHLRKQPFEFLAEPDPSPYIERIVPNGFVELSA